ncbi:MAG TPA: type II 3-dehydroquinate dehydratase, partial [Hyphomicrobiaceae bacterium]|nr:type II 3-dehydroquinate dehydratase [Hyphomicrobiaceae bacterium]
FRREPFRHTSYVSPAAQGMICGFGPNGYELAIEAMAGLLSKLGPDQIADQSGGPAARR